MWRLQLLTGSTPRKITMDSIKHIIAFFLLLIPFGLIWFITFRYLKQYITTLLNYCVLALFSLIALNCYFLMTGVIGFSGIEADIGGLIGSVSYATVIYATLLIIPIIITTLIVTIIHFVNKPKKKQI